MKPRHGVERRLGGFILVTVATVLFAIASLPAAGSAAEPLLKPAATAGQDRSGVDGQAASYQLRFHNYYKSTVYVALMYSETNRCRDYGRYATAGWWAVGWGDEVHVLNTASRYVYFYAFSEDGEKVWQNLGGGWTYVKKGPPFLSCWSISQASPPWQQAHPRFIDMGATPRVYTYNLWA